MFISHLGESVPFAILSLACELIIGELLLMQNTSLEEEQKEQFNFAHLGLIALCAVFLLSVSVMKKGFVFGLNQASRKATHKLTYKEALAQVEAENGRFSGSSQVAENTNPEISEKLALVDPSFQSGQVAGASVGRNGQPVDLTEAKQNLNPENLEKLKINITATAGPEAIKKYSEDLLNLEAEYSGIESISNLASQDKTVLQTIADNLAILSASLLQAEVPIELATYHRLKIIYYGTALAMTDVYLGKPDVANLDELTELFFVVTEQMEKVKGEIYSKYQVGL